MKKYIQLIVARDQIFFVHLKCIVTLFALLISASASAATQSVRIVDFGDDYTWHGGLPTYRQGVSGYGLKRVERTSNTTFDVDGDGQTNDDSYAYHEFSTTVPLNVTEPFYNSDGNSAIFYGGLTSFFANQATYWSEGGINIDHGRDDHNFHSYSNGSGTGVQAWGVWLWKKEDFLNKGDQYNVTFAADSKIGVYVSRYWEDWQEGRFVVKDNGQYYISEHAFGPERYRLYELTPSDSRWALYNPSAAQPYDPSSVAFDTNAATFNNHTFTNIEEVGWYIAKPTLSEAQLWLKWYGFEVHAVVNSPDEPSINLAMTRIVDGGSGNDGLYMANTEVSYSEWRKIYKWAARNAYAITRGFIFERDGDMGNMDDANATHSPNEPVTDITWADAVLWCNALSIYEGFDPVYYADAGLTTPLYEVIIRTNEATMYDNLPIYVDWTANGYRLPTLKEWQNAAAMASGADASAWTSANATGKTQAVGTKSAASNGIHDLIGNVWEFTWDNTADNYAPTAANVRTVVGGDFSLPANVTGETGAEMLKSSARIGFRPVRVIGTASTPDKTNPFSSSLGYTQSSNIPVWRFNEAVPVTNPAVPGLGTTAPTMITLPSGSFHRSDGATVSVTGFDMSETEISFAKWVEVYQWAVANGYQFNRDGDMGSMDYFTGNETHSPNEPVTDIAYEDAMIWCNALSEMEGRTPSYYVDSAYTTVLREAFAFRLNETPERTTIWDFNSLWDSSKTMRTRYLKWDANGYRLPSLAEWEYAARSGENTNLFPWGTSFNGNYGWDADNSGRRTQPVGTKQALSNGLKDTSGNVFEWVWGGGYSYYYNDDPRGEGQPNLRGGSYRISGTGSSTESELLSPSGRTNDPFGYIKPGHAYPEVGFRIICTEAGAHPLEEPPYVPDVVLNIDPATQDVLSEQTYRGDMHRTGQYSGSGVQDAPAVKWSFLASGKVSASPIVYDGVVYVGDEAGMFYALNLSNGSVIWSANTGESTVLSTATVAHGNVYVIAGTRIIAYELATGTEVFNVRGNFGGRHLNPAVIANVVFWNEGWDDLVALDAMTGEEIWRHRDSVGTGKDTSSPVIADGKVFWCSGAQGFYAADVRTERRTWFFDAAVDNWVQTPAYYEGYLYTVGSNGIISINVSNPSLQWFNNTIPYESQAPKMSSPAVDADSVYIGNGASGDGINYGFYSLNRLTGSMQWSFNTAGANTASPALASNSVYFGSADGNMYSLDKSTGSLNWSYNIGSPIYSSPVVAGTILVFGADDNRVYALQSAADIVAAPSTPSTSQPATRQVNLSWAGNAGNETGYTLQRRISFDNRVESVIDNPDAAVTYNGFYTGSWGTDYGAANNRLEVFAASGNNAYARYTPNLTGAEDIYDLALWYGSMGAATNVPVIVFDGTTTHNLVVNQTTNREQWYSLGSYQLTQGAYIEIRGDFTPIPSGSTIRVVADAVRLLKGVLKSGSWETIATLDASTTSYSDNNLPKNTTIDYRVRANRGTDFSDWSQIAAPLTIGDTSDVVYADWELEQDWGIYDDNSKLADPDNDGLENLLEYALVHSPLTSNSDALANVTLEQDSGTDYLSITFTRRKSINDTTLTVQSSSDLTNWVDYKIYTSGANPTADAETTIVSEDSTLQIIKVRYPLSAPSPTFLRLKVSQP